MSAVLASRAHTLVRSVIWFCKQSVHEKTNVQYGNICHVCVCVHVQQLSDSKIASMVESKDFRKGIVQLEWSVSEIHFLRLDGLCRLFSLFYGFLVLHVACIFCLCN